MAAEDPTLEVGFDRPLNAKAALQSDQLGRRGFADGAVRAMRRVNSTSGFALSIEGAWGSGKTSTLAMMEALLREQASPPVIVHFNPWLVGDRDALLRHFLSKIATEVSLADHAADGKKVARELKAYSKVFDFIKLVPGAEPWASLVKSVIESAGDAAEAVGNYKTPDIEARKNKVEHALRRFGRSIIVFIDDIDRLFPLEVFEMVRIIKAVGDLPNVGYVIAWDPDYVSEALKAANVPRSGTYMDKVVQVRLPLPALSPEAKRTLINNALKRLPPEADEQLFRNSEDRLSELYFAGLRELFEQPRDFERVFNTVAIIEFALRGELTLADIIALATLMVKAPSLYECIRKEPRWFVGPFPSEQGGLTNSDEWVSNGAPYRQASLNLCGNPNAVRKLMQHLFPLTAQADEVLVLGRANDIDGHIGAPARLLVAMQLNVSGDDVSFVAARRYLLHPEQRPRIAGLLTHKNCIGFLELLGDAAESLAATGIADIEALCIDIAKLADREPLAARSKDLSEGFRTTAEDVAVRAICNLVQSLPAEVAATVAERIVAEPLALTVAMEILVGSYLIQSEVRKNLRCREEVKKQVVEQFTTNILDAARSGRLLTICNPGFLLWRLGEVAPEKCTELFSILKGVDSTLDEFALYILGRSYDSNKGQIFSLTEDRSKVTVYCPLEQLKEHADRRLADGALPLPTRAAWKAIAEEKRVYAADGSYARH